MKIKKQRLYRASGVKLYLFTEKGTRPRPYLKKSKVVSQVKLIPENKWAGGMGLEVVYQSGVVNSGTFYDLETLLTTLNTWTQASLVEYATGRGW